MYTYEESPDEKQLTKKARRIVIAFIASTVLLLNLVTFYVARADTYSYTRSPSGTTAYIGSSVSITFTPPSSFTDAHFVEYYKKTSSAGSWIYVTNSSSAAVAGTPLTQNLGTFDSDIWGFKVIVYDSGYANPQGYVLEENTDANAILRFVEPPSSVILTSTVDGEGMTSYKLTDVGWQLINWVTELTIFIGAMTLFLLSYSIGKSLVRR